MIKEPTFEWDEFVGTAYCYITDEKGNMFTGEAICHPDDEDFMSERTGCEIAFRRAKIKYYASLRENDLKPRIAALKQLYYSMKHSGNFNEKSYENRMLQRQIRLLEFDLTTLKEMLAYERQSLKDLIEEKDKFYKKIRAKRNGAK